MGLYGHRIGLFSTLCDNQTEKENVMGILKMIARRTYSNPPIQGARIVKTILSNKELYAIWQQDILKMATRISDMRTSLKKSILAAGSTKNWDHITNQIGMFAFTGLNKDQVIQMKEKYAIYMTADGRISIAGLNSKNVDYIGKAFHELTK